MLSAGIAFAMRSLNASVGTDAKGTATASSTLKLKSGMGFVLRRLRAGNDLRAGSQCVEESGNLFPDFVAAGEAFPVGANQPHEPVAIVNWREEIFRGR